MFPSYLRRWRIATEIKPVSDESPAPFGICNLFVKSLAFSLGQWLQCETDSRVGFSWLLANTDRRTKQFRLESMPNIKKAKCT